jgi:hypothetical protein
VWMRLRLALPSDLAGLRVVRAMTDSLLRDAERATAGEAAVLAPLASLTGRGFLAARLSRRIDNRRAQQVPVPVAGDAVALLVYAGLGGPAESLAAFENRLDGGIRQSMDPERQIAARLEWIGYPASMTYPAYVFRSLRSLAGHDDYLINAEAAYTRGDTVAARTLLDNVRLGYRAGLPASEIMLDALFPETQLLVVLGDRDNAIAALDSTLLAQRFAPPNRMANVAQAGMLVRAMAWRAEYAATSHDPAGARLWASPVTILWADADPYLQATVKRMLQLSAR